MITHEICTSTNNKFYYVIYTNNGEIKGSELKSEPMATRAFLSALECNKDAYWGQLICHHYADEWQNEVHVVINALSKEDFK